MKKHILYILGLAVLFAGFSGCEERIQVPTYKQGATVNISNEAGFFNLADISNSSIGFTLTAYNPEAVSVSSVTIQKTFLRGGVAQQGPIDHATVTSFPIDLTVTTADVLTGFSNLTADSLQLGDAFLLEFTVNTSDGQVLKSLSASEFAVTCVSNLAGTYDVVTDHFNSDFGDFEDIAVVVTVTENSPGSYEFDDITGGAWPVTYGDPYGASARPGTVTEVCGVLTLIPADDQFGQNVIGDPDQPSTVSYDASGNPEPFTIYWANDGYLDKGTSVYTPQ